MIDERVVEMNLANLRRVLPHSRALEHPETVGYIYGSLGALRRAGRTVTPDEVRAWALEAGWTVESAWALSRIALAVRDGLPDIGTLSTHTAAEGSLIVSLTADEARCVRAALHLVLSGLPNVQLDGMDEGDLLALIGYNTAQAQAVLTSLNEATGYSGLG